MPQHRGKTIKITPENSVEGIKEERDDSDVDENDFYLLDKWEIQNKKIKV